MLRAMSTLLSMALAMGCGEGASSIPGPPPAESEVPRAEPAGEPRPEPEAREAQAAPRARIALDTHVDTPQRMLDAGDDIAERHRDGHLDLPRMRDGGLDGAFFSIWVDPHRYPGERAWARARALIEVVRALAERHPEEASLCTSADEVRAAVAAGRAAILMGIEGAHALGAPENEEGLLDRLREAHRLGVRYMTITWSNDNALGHSSGGDHADQGLTELGRRAIREMNRLGMIVDVSHVSDRTFWDILEVTERPPLASHSSCRAIADHPRNMSDDMIRAVGERGGAVCLNYYTQFIDSGYARRRRRLEHEHRGALRELRSRHGHSWQRWGPVNRRVRELDPELRRPGLDVLGAHFARVASVAGPGAACLGSDFDGVGELPEGLEDVSQLGALAAELARRGLPVNAILGENVLRVLDAQRSDPILAPR